MLASWRFARNTLSGRRGRSVLLIAATAIACALVVAVSCCTGSAQGAMDGILKTILGPSDVRIIHQFGSRFDDSLLEESRGWPVACSTPGQPRDSSSSESSKRLPNW